MKKERCSGSKYIQQHILKGYKLCFSHKTVNSIYGHANIIKSKKSKVFGALWKINKRRKPSAYFSKSKNSGWLPRQKLKKTYELDGSVYAFFINKKFFKVKSLVFGKSLAYFLKKRDNFDLTGTEIDEKHDFKFAEIALKEKKI